MKKYDIVIVGAGPAGSSCAMALKDSGLTVALIDKHSFPRDKVCGDFVAGKSVKELYKINPQLKNRFEDLEEKAVNKSTHVFVNKQRPLRFDWVLTSITAKREIFDNVLLNEVLDQGKTDFYPSQGLKTIEYSQDGVKLECEGGEAFEAKLVIGADGAHSIVAKNLAGNKVDKNHYAGSVRVYYKNVKNIDPSINEIYVNKDIIPGYLWLFPISESEANVGLGMASKFISRNKVNLRKKLTNFIESDPVIGSKLEDAEMDGVIEGFGLPLYGKKSNISGDRYVLCGDAGSLIDPMNGEGILQAVVSGRMAAECAIQCFEKNEFSKDYTVSYAENVHNLYWKEMRLKSKMVDLVGDRTRLVQSAAWVINNSSILRSAMRRFI